MTMIFVEGFPSELKKPCVLYDNILERGTVTYSSNAADGPNAFDGNTYDSWTPDSLTATMTCTLSEPTTADCLCMTAHTAGTANATLTVEYWDGSAWTVAATAAPTDNGTIMALWVPKTSDQWRISVSGGTVPSIGAISLGKRLVFDMGITGDYVPTNWAESIEVLGGVSLGGQFINQRLKRQGGSTNITLATQDRDWFETKAAGFLRHYNYAKPFFFAGGPRTVPNDLAFCRRGQRDSELRPRLVLGGKRVKLTIGVSFYVPT